MKTGLEHLPAELFYEIMSFLVRMDRRSFADAARCLLEKPLEWVGQPRRTIDLDSRRNVCDIVWTRTDRVDERRLLCVDWCSPEILFSVSAETTANGTKKKTSCVYKTTPLWELGGVAVDRDGRLLVSRPCITGTIHGYVGALKEGECADVFPLTTGVVVRHPGKVCVLNRDTEDGVRYVVPARDKGLVCYGKNFAFVKRLVHPDSSEGYPRSVALLDPLTMTGNHGMSEQTLVVASFADIQSVSLVSPSTGCVRKTVRFGTGWYLEHVSFVATSPRGLVAIASWEKPIVLADHNLVALHRFDWTGMTTRVCSPCFDDDENVYMAKEDKGDNGHSATIYVL